MAEQQRLLTEDERAQGRRWLEQWRVTGVFLEQERWTRIEALTDDEAWEESEGLLQAWEPVMRGDDGEGLLLHQRVFARGHRTPQP